MACSWMFTRKGENQTYAPPFSHSVLVVDVPSHQVDSDGPHAHLGVLLSYVDGYLSCSSPSIGEYVSVVRKWLCIS